MMEMIRSQVMKRITSKQAIGRKMKGDICPKIRKKLDLIIDMSYEYNAEFAGSAKAQVRGPEGQFSVDLDKRTCACRRWELTAIPCVHAVAAIIEQNEDPFSYVDQCYNKTVYQQVYSHLINPTNGPELWEAYPSPPGIFLPPHGNKKKRGRMPTARKKEAEELEK